MDTGVRIDIVNIYELVLAIAKHSVGKMTDEELIKLIDQNEPMFKAAQKNVAMLALKDLVNMIGDEDDGEE